MDSYHPHLLLRKGLIYFHPHLHLPPQGGGIYEEGRLPPSRGRNLWGVYPLKGEESVWGVGSSLKGGGKE